MNWKYLFAWLLGTAFAHGIAFVWFLDARNSFATSSTPIHLFALMLIATNAAATLVGVVLCSDWANTKPSDLEEK